MSRLTLAAAIAMFSLAIPASASDSLSSRSVTALGVAIASQGDAALAQIRRELQQSARDTLKPFLPEARKAPPHPQPAETPVAQR